MGRRSCEIVKVRNITVSVDEETHRQARIRAAELDTSVSALVREFLTRLGRVGDEESSRAPGSETALDRRRRLLNRVFADFDARGIGLRMSENLPREALYDRAVTKPHMRPGSDTDSAD